MGIKERKIYWESGLTKVETLLTILVLVLTMIIVGIAIQVSRFSKEHAGLSGSDNKPDNYEVAEKMGVSNTNKAIKRLKNGFEKAKQHEYITYFQYDGYEVYMIHNSMDESILQHSESGSITIHRSDGKSIAFEGDSCYYGVAATEVDVAYEVLKAVESGKAEIYKVSRFDVQEGFSQYYVDVHGIEELRSIISNIESNLADLLINRIQSNLVHAGLSEDSLDQVNFRYHYVLYDEGDWIELLSCMVYLGDSDPLSVTWDDITYLWRSNNFGQEIATWSLEPEFYSLDFDNLANFTDEEMDYLYDVLIRQTKEISSTIDAYVNYIVETEKDSEAFE